MSAAVILFFFFKQKTAYEMRISDWSSDVCSSDLVEQIGRAEKARRELHAAPADIGGEHFSGGSALIGRRQPAMQCKHLAGLAGIAGDTIRLEQLLLRRRDDLAVERGVARGIGVAADRLQIGRESCRERVCQYV